MSQHPPLPACVATERLVLRQWQRDDVPALAMAVTESLEHLRPWMPWAADEPLSVEERIRLVEGWQAAWQDGGDSVLGIFLNGRPIGGTGLHRRLGPDVIEIGYWIHVAHVRRGYATEAAEALTAAAFGIDDISRVEIRHDKANVASRSVPMRLGYTLATEVSRAPTAPAERGVECCWVMTRTAWIERS